MADKKNDACCKRCGGTDHKTANSKKCTYFKPRAAKKGKTTKKKTNSKNKSKDGNSMSSPKVGNSIKPNGKKCVACGGDLTGRQRKFCSPECQKKK